jgi:replicative DNA helicase
MTNVTGLEAAAAKLAQKQKPDPRFVPPEPVIDIWPDPILPGSKQTPEILADILPGIFGEHAAAVAESTQTPQALATMFTLSVLATVLQGRFEVSPYGDDYLEPLSIWTTCCYPVGGRKTAVFNACVKAVQQWEKLNGDRSRSEIARRKSLREVALKKIEFLKNAAAKAGDAEERERLRNEIQLELENMPAEMKAARCFTSNATPERTEGLLSEQGGKIGILSDESDTFLNLSGGLRGGMASLDVVLKGHAGSSIRVDRQGREAHLDRPAVSMGLIVQPETFGELAAGRRLRNTGILARYLYAIPKSNIGQRDVRKRVSIPRAIADGYHDAVMNLLQGYEDHTAEPVILGFSSEAREPLIEFAEEIEREQGEGGKFEEISDWTSKLPGAVVRLAAIFQLAQDGLAARTVQVGSVGRALYLCRLLIPHAQAAFAMLGADDTDTDALAVLRWIRDDEKKEFTRHSAQLAMRRRFSKIERLIDALSVLRDNYIISGEKKTSSGGRPSAFYLVNPKLYARGKTS